MVNLIGYVIIEVALSFYSPVQYPAAAINLEPGMVIKTHGALYKDLDECNKVLSDWVISWRDHDVKITPEHHYDRSLGGFVESRKAEEWRHENGKNWYQCIPIYDEL